MTPPADVALGRGIKRGIGLVGVAQLAVLAARRRIQLDGVDGTRGLALINLAISSHKYFTIGHCLFNYYSSSRRRRRRKGCDGGG
jgi:hypothetical protein